MPALGILCYHRVIGDDVVDLAWPYLERGTAVRLSTFRAQVAELTGFADIIPEHLALEVLAGRRNLERPAVWLTFDDGYQDVLLAARHTASATAFITTGASERMLPADAWYAVLLGAKRVRGELDLGLGAFDYDLGHRAGRARLVHGRERQQYLRARASDQAATLTALANQLEADVAGLSCYLSQNDLRSVLAAGWSLGSHGVTHAMFDATEPGDVRREARVSRAALCALGAEVRSLALPNGSVPSTPAALLTEGYQCLLGLGNAPAESGAMVQPRFIVPDDPAWVSTNLQPRIS